VIIVVEIITKQDTTKCWNAFLRHLLRLTRELTNCFKRDTFRNSMLIIASISPETKLTLNLLAPTTVGARINPYATNVLYYIYIYNIILYVEYV